MPQHGDVEYRPGQFSRYEYSSSSSTRGMVSKVVGWMGEFIGGGVKSAVGKIAATTVLGEAGSKLGKALDLKVTDVERVTYETRQKYVFKYSPRFTTGENGSLLQTSRGFWRPEGDPQLLREIDRQPIYTVTQ